MKSSIKTKRGEIENVYKIYTYIASMIADQTNQNNQENELILQVTDASGDTNLEFETGETRRQAFYRYNGTATGSINDYTLISSPYGNNSPNELTSDELAGIQNANGLNSGNPVATMGDLEEINFTTDESLYLDTTTKELRANVSDFSEKYTYTSGAQEFVLTSTPVKIIYISVNGQLLEDPLTQWSINVPTKTITILDELHMEDRVTIHYQHLITI